MYISDLEHNLITRMANEIFSLVSSQIISKEDINKAIEYIGNQKQLTKYEFCNNLNALSYIYSILLSEVRASKRKVLSALFINNPKLAQEKSTLKEKLDADEEYANLHNQEELLFQFVEHIKEIKNNIIFLMREEENSV